MRNTKALAEGCINPRAIDRYFFTYLDKIELPWQNFFSVEGSLLKGQVWLRGGSESWQALPLEWGKRF